MITGTGAHGKGWRLDELDLPGKTMVSSERYSEPNEGRCYWNNEQQIHDTSLKHAPVDDAAEEVRPHPQPEPDPPTPPSGGGGPRGGRPLLRAVPTFPDGSRIPENSTAHCSNFHVSTTKLQPRRGSSVEAPPFRRSAPGPAWPAPGPRPR